MISVEDKERLRKEYETKRNTFEKENLGDYEMIYPCEDNEKTKYYDKLLEGATDVWE